MAVRSGLPLLEAGLQLEARGSNRVFLVTLYCSRMSPRLARPGPVNFRRRGNRASGMARSSSPALLAQQRPGAEVILAELVLGGYYRLSVHHALDALLNP